MKMGYKMVNLSGVFSLVLGIAMIVFKNFFINLWWPSGYGRGHAFRILRDKISNTKNYDRVVDRYPSKYLSTFTILIGLILIITGIYLIFF